jgi:hypothetical protein
MNATPETTLGKVGVHLGRCPRCMRQSFIATLGAWAFTLWALLSVGETVVTALMAALALGLSALWIGHLIAFAARATPAFKERNKTDAASGEGLSRRQLMPMFARTLGAAALATALPSSAFAQDRINNCLTCCAQKVQSCGSDNACNINYQNCVSSCNSHGQTPAAWRCW